MPSACVYVRPLLASQSFAQVASDRALHLRLTESGISKEVLASFSALAMPLSVVFAIMTGRMARAGSPLSGALRLGMAVRLLSGLGGTAMLALLDGGPPSALVVMLLFVLFVCATFGASLTFVSSCAFFNVISDPVMGGTWCSRCWVSAFVFVAVLLTAPFTGSYLTLLNTVANLGKAWSVPAIMALIDALGFTFVNVLSLSVGFVYLYFSQSTLLYLEKLPASAWSLDSSNV